MILCRYGVWKIMLWWLGVRVTTLGSMIVVFDSCWTSPCSDGTEESTMYRFGSIGKNTQKIHWCCMDIGSRGAMMLFKETEQGKVFDSTHQGFLSFLGALCLEDVSKDF